MHPVPTRKTVAHACDACRRRKIKCNGLQPCPGCIAARLPCTYNIPQKRGGNKGARATVLNELRGTYQSGHAAPIASPTHSASSASPPRSQSFNTNGLEPSAVEACTDAYLERIYPVVPFLTRDILNAEASRASNSLLSRQFITAFCAYVVGFGKVLDKPEIAPYASDTGIGKQLLDAALRIHVLNRISLPSPQAIFISFFLYGAYASLGDYRQGWFYLREAITLFLLQRGTGESTWFTHRIYARTFWVLLVSERSHGIRRNRPITIQVTPDSPSLHEPEEIGLQYLASIFRPFDEVFFAIWNGSSNDCSKEWLLRLESRVRNALPDALEVSSEQIANLRVSQLWLQVKLFELSPRFGFLSSESGHECLTFGYPIVLARELIILAMKLPIGSLQIHGVGMTEKIFDIACALADVLPFVSTAASQTELGPVDYLTQTAALLAKLPGGSTKFIPLLLAKINELLPDLIKPLCEAIELPGINIEPLSPDSRFIYEEEVTTSLYANLRRNR